MPEKYSLGADDLDSINDIWARAVKYMPDGTIILKQNFFIKNKFSTENFPNESFLQKTTSNYFNKRTYLDHQCKLFFILPSIETFFNSKIINPFNKLNKKKINEYDGKIENFINTITNVVDFLNGQKINSGKAFSVTPITEKEGFKLEDFWFSGFQNDYIADRKIEKDFIKIGDKYVGGIAILDEKYLPDNVMEYKLDKNLSSAKYKFFESNGDVFGFGLPFSHVYTQIIFKDENQKHRNELHRNNEQLNKSRKFSKENEAAYEQTSEILDDILKDEGISLVRGHNNIFVLSDSVEELKDNLNTVITQCKELDITPYKPAGNYLNSIFTYSYFLFTQYFTVTQTYICNLNLAVTYFNNTSNFKSDEKGVVYSSRLNNNVPVILDLWDEKKKYVNARNFFIIAPTGFGKSFNANHLFRQYYEEGSKTVIIDLGGSYKKLSALYPNDTAYITYEEGKPLGINPFSLQDIGGELTTAKLEELTNFVITHYKREDVPHSREMTAMKKIIESYYQLKNSKKEADYNFPDFIEFVKNNKETLLNDLEIEEEFFNIKEFLFLTSEFVGEGVYNFLYKKSESIVENLKDKKIIIFELDQIKENQLLLTVMLQIISDVINTVVWQDKSTRGYIFFDEVAKQLKFKGILHKIEYFFQAIRKQNGSIGIVLQAISQLPENEASNSIIENTQILFVLNAKDYRTLQKRFNMSEHSYNQMVSISSNFEAKNPYSELFIMRGNQHQVYRLEVPKEVYWAYQTEGKENERLMTYYEETGNMEKAIKNMINDK